MRDMLVILPKGNGYTKRAMKLSSRRCKRESLFAGCTRECDEGKQVQDNGQQYNEHHCTRSDLFKRLSNDDGQDHAAYAAAHEEPTCDRTGDMHPFFGERDKSWEDRCQRNTQ